ncbi:UPF0306 protein YhbP [Bacteroidia bacterium]|nr:UPF0306 protein YhbP [Bacteroidia bacterium]
MEQKFIDIIKAHHVLTLATSHNNIPYCANVFYAFLEQEQYFVFLSDSKTTHAKHFADNSSAAASIFLETKTVGKIQGLQLQGVVYQPNSELSVRAQRAYLQCFPYAILIPSTLWIFEPTWAKLTDNRFGIGKKLIWEKSNE